MVMKRADLLRHAALRASKNPFFIAGYIEGFRTRRGVQESDLARFLGCEPEVLPKLGLCRRPDPDSTTFQSDVHRIANAFGISPNILVQLIREADSLNVLGMDVPVARLNPLEGLLMAARDKELVELQSNEPSDEQDIPEEEHP